MRGRQLRKEFVRRIYLERAILLTPGKGEGQLVPLQAWWRAVYSCMQKSPLDWKSTRWGSRLEWPTWVQGSIGIRWACTPRAHQCKERLHISSDKVDMGLCEGYVRSREWPSRVFRCLMKARGDSVDSLGWRGSKWRTKEETVHRLHKQNYTGERASVIRAAKQGLGWEWGWGSG